MGRPGKPVDWEKVDRLLMAGCKGTEIAPHFDINVHTFYRKVEEQYSMTFTEYCALKRDQGISLIRVKQFEKAIKGDNTMLVWLGKNLAGQKENMDAGNVQYDPDTIANLNRLMSLLKGNQERSIEESNVKKAENS